MVEIWVLIWFFLILIGLTLLQRRLHFEIQACFLLVTRRPDISMVIFAILFLPGVFIHEASHYLAAKLLGVEAVRFSLLPEMVPGGRLRLGYVETVRTDIFRDALIGLAPLVTGGAIIALILYAVLDLSSPWSSFDLGDLSRSVSNFAPAFRQPDFWLWFYGIFVISSTMFPSSSDRRAWLPLALLAFLLVGVGLLAGIGPWLSDNLLPRIMSFIGVISFVFGASALAHLVLLLPFWALRRFLSRLSSFEIA